MRRRMMMGQGGEVDYSQMYLTFKALESGTFTFSRNTISYSLNGGSTWTALAAGTASPTIAAGQKICWKASGITPSGSYGIGTFSSTGLFDVYGNIMSMQAGDDFETATTMASYQFRSLFQSCTKLVDASNMILPPTVTSYCFNNMFRSCTALTTAPELPAAGLSANCYERMFYLCSSLAYIKCLATDISASSCLYQWVQGVAATGTFVKDASMTSWPEGINGIPSGWTVIDAT